MPPDVSGPPGHRARLATLDALGRSPVLAGRYVLKGGLVLQHVYGSPRPSEDLDFNAVEDVANEVTEGKEHRLVRFAAALDDALAEAAPRFGLAGMAVQAKRLSDVLPTLLAEVGYTTDPDRAPPYPDAVEMQATLSEVVCATTPAEVGGVPVVVPTRDDLAADKLKTLLQMARRTDERTHDVWDLWWLLAGAGAPPDAARVADFLRRKCGVWAPICDPRRADFHDPAVRTRGAEGYAKLVATAAWGPVPPFDEAFGAVLRFVDTLPLPA